jgi:hypothetical protein
MLQTVRDACEFDPKAIDYALSDQVESLEDLVAHEPGAAEAFFRKTYVTGGMRTLLRQGLQRLAGQSGQAVFELKQSMGGGKTHSMLALGYLGANPGLTGLIPQEIVAGFKPAKARVVAISGRAISRAVIQGASGAGKTYAIRRILETTHGRMQHIVFDVEDELFTLRERFDYVLIGGDGADAPLTEDTAGELAITLLELGVSAILQLNDFGLTGV